MNHITTETVNVIHTKSEISHIGPNDSFLPEAPISTSRKFHNNLPFNVHLVTRLGLPVRATNGTLLTDRTFRIITEYYIRSEAFPQVKKWFDRKENKGNYHLDIVKEAFYRHFNSRSNIHVPGITVTIETRVTEEHLRNNGGSVYIHNEDLLVSSVREDDIPEHPYSQGVIQCERLGNLNADSDVSLNIHIIDNSGTIGKRFILIANKMYTLHPQRSDTQPDGVYIYSVEKSIDQQDEKIVMPTHYELSECEKLGIYKSKEECISGGDIKTVRREELLETEHRLSMEKLNLEADNQRLKRELSQIEHDRKLEIERLNIAKVQREEAFAKLQHEFKEKITAMENERKQREEEFSKTDLERRTEFAKVKADIEEREAKAKEAAAQKEREYAAEITRLTFANKQMEMDRDRERAELERQRIIIKDYYDNRSHIRKDQSELLKFLPTIISGVLGIVTLALVKTKAT